VSAKKNKGEFMNSLKGNDNGFTGLEAAIVLIAFVVVAAVFSYVVLGAGFFTSQKAQETVYKGVQQATTNVLLKGSIYGLASDTTAGIDNITFTMGLAPGAPSIDITKMIIVYSNATVAPVMMNYSSTAPTTSGTFWAAKDNMGGEDQVMVYFLLPAPAPKNTEMHIEVRPGGGGAAIPFTKTVPPTVNNVNVLP
jgi:archaeal flagellin FlaB